MPSSLDSPPRKMAVVRRLPRRERPLGNILQELAVRAPEWIAALRVIAEGKLSDLDASERKKKNA